VGLQGLENYEGPARSGVDNNQGDFMRYVIAVAIAFSVLITSATGQQVTEDTSTNAVFLGCKSFAETQRANLQLLQLGNFCSGVVHGLAYVGKILPPEIQSCAPPTSDARQLARVVVKYIEARPQRMHEDFRHLTLEAFHYAWPCKSGG